MKKNLILFISILLFSTFLMSCETKKDDTTDPTDSGGSDSTTAVAIQGKVVSAQTGENLSGAIIKVSDGSIVKGTTTNSDGEYSTTFEMEGDGDLTIVVFKAGYFQDTTSVFAIIGETTDVPLFQLQRDESSNAGNFSGVAASIYLFSQSSESVGVKESGSIESMQIVFEVMDSSGVVIGEDNAIDLSFRFGNTPGGGEYLYPSSIRTNALGKAAVSLNTGTIAGVCQVIAEAVVDGKPIVSKPILVAIHGGFPFQDNFHVACEKLNYSAYGVIGEEIDFTGFAGDRYSNPVREGTSIYFNTTSGIIQGSGQTGDLGTTTVKLLTEGDPIHPLLGKGYFVVSAFTADENTTEIKDTTLRLLSGFPSFQVDPSSFAIENGGGVIFNVTLTDGNNNPLSSDYKYSVSVGDGDIELGGNTDSDIPDALFGGPGITQFSFLAADAQPDTVNPQSATIFLNADGPLGKLSVPISGTSE